MGGQIPIEIHYRSFLKSCVLNKLPWQTVSCSLTPELSFDLFHTLTFPPLDWSIIDKVGEIMFLLFTY